MLQHSTFHLMDQFDFPIFKQLNIACGTNFSLLKLTTHASIQISEIVIQISHLCVLIIPVGLSAELKVPSLLGVCRSSRVVIQQSICGVATALGRDDNEVSNLWKKYNVQECRNVSRHVSGNVSSDCA